MRPGHGQDRVRGLVKDLKVGAPKPPVARRDPLAMRGAVLVGSFTVSSRLDRPLSPDRYEIASVEKVGDDAWRFNARLVHEGMDVTLPIVVPMRWVGDTPMILMTNYAIPTLGTFNARVFFYKDHYAGTWGHDDTVAGHLFGRIERAGT